MIRSWSHSSCICNVFISIIPDVPDAPRNLEVTDVNKHAITLEWMSPRNDGGAQILGYVVERRQGRNARFVHVSRGLVPDTYFRDTKVFEDCEYEYRIAAENEAGVGQYTNPVGPIVAKDPFGKV